MRAGLDGWLVAAHPVPRLLVPWPVTSRPTASLTSASPKSVGKVNAPQPQGSELGDKASQTLVSALEERLRVALGQ